MNQITSCPMCHGHGRILITDYVERMVQHDWPIKCPVCTGLGMIRGVQGLVAR
jgi:DnaJ-class molecular chaperone